MLLCIALIPARLHHLSKLTALIPHGYVCEYPAIYQTLSVNAVKEYSPIKRYVFILRASIILVILIQLQEPTSSVRQQARESSCW